MDIALLRRVAIIATGRQAHICDKSL